MLLTIESEDSNPETCKGAFFRGRVSCYERPSTGAIVIEKTLVPLKRMSCDGCDQCGYISEFLQNVGYDYLEDQQIQNGKIYQAVWVNSWTDYETGHQEFDLLFTEIKS